MTAVKVSVYDRNMTFIAHVPRRKAVRWQDELNVPGSGSFQIHLDDALLTSKPNLLDDFNIVQYSVAGVPVKSWVIEAKDRTYRGSGEGADRWVTVSGRGVLCLLGNAVVYPEYNLHRTSADSRGFDHGSKDGGWRVPGDYLIPNGTQQNNPGSVRRGYPLRWPDPTAQWLWSTNPNAPSSPGQNYFRGSFNLTSPTRVTIFATGDNDLQLQLDGEVVLVARSWHYTSGYTVNLDSGTHLIAAVVNNYGGAGGSSDPAGFICSVAKVDRNNKVLQWLKRSTPQTFRVRGYGSPPGWFGASILKTLVTEAKARSVEGFSPITFGFSDTNDTAGAAWTGRNDRSFDIGSRDLLDVTNQLTETDFDIDMSPALVLNAWKQRGTDRSATVRLLPAKDVTQHSAAANSSRIKTRALTRHGGGWIEYVDGAASTYGRRETGLVVGSTQSDSQAQTFSVAAFNDLGRPEVTLPVTTTSASGKQAYTDYNVGDIVTAPGLMGTLDKARLMALTADEDDNGLLTFAHDFYPEP